MAGDPSPSPSPSGGRTTNKKTLVFNSLCLCQKKKKFDAYEFHGKNEKTSLPPHSKPDQLS